MTDCRHGFKCSLLVKYKGSSSEIACPADVFISEDEAKLLKKASWSDTKKLFAKYLPPETEILLFDKISYFSL